MSAIFKYYEEELGLQYPPNLTKEQMEVWREYYGILIRGYTAGIIRKDQIFDFEKKFFN